MNNKKHKKIIAIDPGYERLGIAILEKTPSGSIEIISSECFKTDPKKNFPERLNTIGQYLESIISKHRPTALCVENLFLSKNQKTAMRVAEVRGVILYIHIKENLDIFELTPLQIKSAVTGNGRSDKVAVEKMIRIILPKLKNVTGKIDDEFDAIACGLAYFALEKSL